MGVIDHQFDGWFMTLLYPHFFGFTHPSTPRNIPSQIVQAAVGDPEAHLDLVVPAVDQRERLHLAASQQLQRQPWSRPRSQATTQASRPAAGDSQVPTLKQQRWRSLEICGPMGWGWSFFWLNFGENQGDICMICLGFGFIEHFL